MRQSSSRWLAGFVLLAALAIGGVLTPPVEAQSPQTGALPAWAVPTKGGPAASGTGSPASTLQPGLPLARPSGNQLQRQDGLIRLARNVPGDAKPVILDADQITSWTEDGVVVFLLSGQVLVQQSVVQARFEQGVVWVDMRRYKSTGILHVDLYAEGKVWVDASSKIQEGPAAVLDLNTRGEFRVRVAKGKMQRSDRGFDPVVVRARGLGIGPRRAPGPVSAVPAAVPSGITPVSAPPSSVAPALSVPSAVVPASRTVPAPSTPPSGVQQMSFEQPKSSASDSASSNIRLVQAATPGPVGASIPDGPPETVPAPDPTPGTFGPSGPGDSGPGRTPFPSPGSEPIVPLPLGPTPGPRTVPSPPSTISPPVPQGLPVPAGPPVEVPPSVLPAPTPSAPPVVPVPPPPRVTQPPPPGTLPPTPVPTGPIEYRVLPRSGKKMNFNREEDKATGRQVITVTGGLILNIRNLPKIGMVDMEADRAVIWVNKNDESDRVARELQAEGGSTSNELEIYLAGHVVLRTRLSSRERGKIEADELYYDARRNVAVALQARMELRTQRFNQRAASLNNEPVIISTPRLLQTGADTFEVTEAELFSSKLPSDPGLKLLVARATVNNRYRETKNIFGQPILDKNGQPVTVEESIIVAHDVVAELEGVPFFYLPYLKTDVRDPMGPLQTINFGYNQIYGATFGLGFDGYKLLGLDPVQNTRWRILTDYLSRRGPALGSNFDYSGPLPGLSHNLGGDLVTPKFEGSVRLYGIYDQAQDILGGNRPYLPFNPPGLRGRAFWRQSVWDLPEGFNVIAQMSLLSDRNFLEQYFKREFDSEADQSNFLYVKQQQDNWAWTALGQVQTSRWIDTTEWLPRLDGYLIGQPFFDLFTTNVRAGVGYANLRRSNDPEQPVSVGPTPPNYLVNPTIQNDSTARAYFLQEIGIPLDFGAIKFVPYAKGALVEYTRDLNGDQDLRAWGGLGARASMPLTRLYADAQSELFNVNGLNHKIVFTGNYFYARANNRYTNVPQLDLLNDDATNSMLREFKPNEPTYNTKAGYALATSPLYDPQLYAIRRLVENRIDTLDNIDVLQLDVRQRLQTKRGFPGAEHIVDWMTLDTSVSFFPETNQNFGKSFSFLEYQYTWNIGDRTTFESTGWYDPQDNGARVYTLGMYFNRPDRTSFYLGYRQIDPLQSRTVTGSINYTFSPKYAMTFTSSYDFGTRAALTNTLVFTRTGSDLQVSLGFSYNALQNNFGAIVEVVPSLLPSLAAQGAGAAGLLSR